MVSEGGPPTPWQRTPATGHTTVQSSMLQGELPRVSGKGQPLGGQWGAEGGGPAPEGPHWGRHLAPWSAAATSALEAISSQLWLHLQLEEATQGC